MIDQYVVNLRKLRAIGIDVGDKDGLAGNNRNLSRILTPYGVAFGRGRRGGWIVGGDEKDEDRKLGY